MDVFDTHFLFVLLTDITERHVSHDNVNRQYDLVSIRSMTVNLKHRNTFTITESDFEKNVSREILYIMKYRIFASNSSRFGGNLLQRPFVGWIVKFLCVRYIQ